MLIITLTTIKGEKYKEVIIPKVLLGFAYSITGQILSQETSRYWPNFYQVINYL